MKKESFSIVLRVALVLTMLIVSSGCVVHARTPAPPPPVVVAAPAPRPAVVRPRPPRRHRVIVRTPAPPRPPSVRVHVRTR